MYLLTFSERLKDLMELEGISNRALSARIATDRKNIREWLQGKHIPRCDALLKLAVCFQVSTDYLVGLDDNVNCIQSEREHYEMRETQQRFFLLFTQFMRDKKITQYAVARDLQIGQKCVSNWLKKDSMPETPTLIKLSQMMNCTLDFLLGRV